MLGWLGGLQFIPEKCLGALREAQLLHGLLGRHLVGRPTLVMQEYSARWGVRGNGFEDIILLIQ